jgi:dihydroneopterin aldolase
MKETRVLRNVVVWDRKASQQVVIDLDVEVDINRIAHQLAVKAYNNKRRKTGALNGLVEVRMRGTKATPMQETAA